MTLEPSAGTGRPAGAPLPGRSVGSPPAALDIAVDVAIALDVGGTDIKCALVDPAGRARHAQRRPTGREHGPERVLRTVLDTAFDLASQATSLGMRPVAVGLVVPGVVDEPGGRAQWSANLGFREVPLRDLVAEELGLPAVLGHDVRAAAMAEARLGTGRAYRRMFFVAIGTGIAGGLVLDGRVDPGAHGASGEIGHVVVRTGPDAPACGCGGRGCVEAVASAAAVARAYAARTGHDGGEPPTAAQVAARVEAGDPAAVAVWHEAVAALADGLLTAVALHDPELVVLGGGLAQSGALLLDPLRLALAQRRTFHQLPVLARSELGDQAGCLGAALLALDLVRTP